MSAIDDIRLKVQRATEHLETFKASFFGQTGRIFPPAAVSLSYDPGDLWFTARANPLQPDQRLWFGILLGDVIHQLRASLDHLIYSLAVRPGSPEISKEDMQRLGFPICTNPEHFSQDSRISQGSLVRLIGSDAVQLVRSAQPFEKTPDSPKRDALWQLHRLDIMDKHHTVVVLESHLRGVATAYSANDNLSHRVAFNMQLLATTGFKTERFELGWPHEEPPRAMLLEQAFRFLTFHNTQVCDGLEVFATMRAMIDRVDRTLVEFDPLFPFERN